MKAALKKKWVAALRSGKYMQGEGYLFTASNGRHCCLGVLRHCVTGSNSGFERQGDNGSELLNGAFLRRIGMSHQGQKTLATMNDDGRTFNEIADYIEKRH